ncbi:MAG: hypothetical protein LBJ39_03295, partial [Tannerellaceae bacterium]|nr:hypothetical protein [Tannerellaceae bacterium]
MKKIIHQLKWGEIMEQIDNVRSIGEDIIMMENPVIPMAMEHPFKVDMLHVIISTKGISRGKINLQPYTAQSPCMVAILAGQILEYDCVSDDFEGVSIVMSQRFTDNLNIEDAFSAYVAVRDNPVIPLTENAMEAVQTYCSMMFKTVKADDNPHRLEIARNLTRAFFYGAGYYFYKAAAGQKNRNEAFADRFMRLVQSHFKTHREVDFYAGKMGLTPKYMSSVIRKS